MLATLEATPSNPPKAAERPESPARHAALPNSQEPLPQPDTLPLPTTQEESRRLSNTITPDHMVRVENNVNPPTQTNLLSVIVPQDTPQVDLPTQTATLPLPHSPPILVSNTEATLVSPPTSRPDNDQSTSPTPNNSPQPPTNLDPVNVNMKSLEDKIDLLRLHFLEWQREVEMRLIALEEKSAISKINPTTTNHSAPIPPHPPTVSSPPHTLILGDSNLAQLCTTDLKNCKIKTLEEASVDQMTQWVQNKLTWTPDKCIIYGGLFNIKAGETIDSTIDSLGILMSELKKKNNEMKICVSLLAPSIESGLLSKCVSEFNDQTSKWAINNNILHADIQEAFVDENSVTVKTCYVENGRHQGSLLNRDGVIRLLKGWCIELNGFSSCVNWERVQENTRLKHASLRETPRVYHSEHPSQHYPAPHHPLPPHSPTTRDEEGWQLVTRGRRQPYRNGRRSVAPSTSHGTTPGRYDDPTESIRSHRDGRGLTQPGHFRGRKSQINSTPAFPGQQRDNYHASLYIPPNSLDTTTGSHPRHHHHHSPHYGDPQDTSTYQARERRGPGRPETYDRGHYPQPRERHYPRGDETVLRMGNSLHPTHRHHSHHYMMNGGNTWYQQEFPPLPSPPYSTPPARGSCFNCGERNHVRKNCRYDQKIRCFTCNMPGHKSKHCEYHE